jgi:hypothetical protein
MNELIKRQRAAQACIDAFLHRPLKFGVHDCVRLAAFNCRKLGIAVPDLKGLKYRTEAGAVKALKAQGYADLIEAVDAMGFARIAPATRWPADIVALPPAEGTPWGASLMIAGTNGRLIGLSNGVFHVVEPAQFVCAWRVPAEG